MMNTTNGPTPIEIGKQYRIVFWRTIVVILLGQVLALSIQSSGIVPEEHQVKVYGLITFLAFGIMVPYYYIPVKNRFTCPVCAHGKLDLQNPDDEAGEELHYYCPACKKSYISDLVYKKSLMGANGSSCKTYITITKKKAQS